MCWASEFYEPDNFHFNPDPYDDMRFDDDGYWDYDDEIECLADEQHEIERQHSQTIANYLCLFDDDGNAPRVNKEIVELPTKQAYWGENNQWWIPPF